MPLHGTTLHSFAGIGLGDGAVPDLLAKIRSNQKAYQNWTKCKTLIIGMLARVSLNTARSPCSCLKNYTLATCIDEVSMLDRELFEKLNTIARNMKRSTLPFGGIQLILVGDFHQV